MPSLPTFRRGQPLTDLRAADFNAIVDAIKARTILPSKGVLVRQTTSGVTLSVQSQTGGGAPATPQPWDLQSRQDPDNENQYLVRVRPGTLNSFLPTNWDEEFSCADTGLHYAKAIITTDGQAVTGLTIAIDTTAPVEQEPVKFGIETNIEYLFGLFAQGAVYRVIAAGHIVLQPEQWLVASADPAAAPGQSPYDIYYRFQ